MAKRNHSFFSKMIFAIMFSLIIFGAFCLIYTIFIYFGNIKVNNLILYLIGLASFFILGFLSGNFLNKNGLLIGFINGGILILFMLIIRNFKINNFKEVIKYLTYLLISATGGLIGLNFKPLIS